MNNKIAQLNDQIRSRLCKSDRQFLYTLGAKHTLECGTQFMIRLTDAVTFSENVDEILHQVATFSDFNESNDPWGEHDVGRINVLGTAYLFKFDYYDQNWEFYCENGHRLLTIMEACEY